MAATSGAAALLALMVVAGSAAASLNTSPVPFEAGYMPLFGGDNLVRSPGGRSVRLKLDARTGSGFVSKSAYHHGYFSASIKLPDDHTAGVVVAFYEDLLRAQAEVDDREQHIQGQGRCRRPSCISWLSGPEILPILQESLVFRIKPSRGHLRLEEGKGDLSVYCSSFLFWIRQGRLGEGKEFDVFGGSNKKETLNLHGSYGQKKSFHRLDQRHLQ